MEAMGIISTIFVGLEKNSETQTSKVFFFNRFASLVFLIAILFIAIKFKSFDFSAIQAISIKNPSALFSPTILLLVACLCKGAQMPFSYWLIDAVKANNFASILIHAGTIVGIGIIFITKAGGLFDCFPILNKIMLAFGLCTAFWMSCCAMAHNNIKKIMACLTAASTGIMFMACGLRGYSLAILYFICHAFFKSLLFLSFTYLISATSGEYNILKLGGLNKFAPRINKAIWVSFLSAIGFPFLSGFFAKITFMSLLQSSSMHFLMISNIIINMIMTAAIFRLVFLSMYGKSRMDDLTLSRVTNSNLYNMKPIWGLFITSIAGSLIAWKWYELGTFHFGVGGSIYIHDIWGYFIENIMEITQILAAILLMLLFIKHSKAKFNSNISSVSIAIFRRNEIYYFFSDIMKNSVLFIMQSLDKLNKKLSGFLSTGFFNSIYSLEKIISEKHKKSFFSHALWIFLGLFLGMLTILIWSS
jgi:NADH-quinone oxidoreductase subunit L